MLFIYIYDTAVHLSLVLKYIQKQTLSFASNVSLYMVKKIKIKIKKVAIALLSIIKIFTFRTVYLHIKNNRL